MRHDLLIEGEAFSLRPVTEGDAAAIVELRSDPMQSRFVHAISPRVEDQLDWMGRYFAREGDYYFAVENTSTRRFEGTVALYDVADGQAEWGRWVLKPGSLAAPESALLIYRAAFEVLRLEEVYCRTVALNDAVLSFHDRCGLRRAGVLENAFTIGVGPVDAVEHRLPAVQWPDVRDRLAVQAERVARLVRRARPDTVAS